MNPGVTEEAGLTARTIVESLKSAPGTLALVIFNILFIAAVAYLSIHTGNRFDRETQRWQEIATNAVRLCGPPPQLQ